MCNIFIPGTPRSSKNNKIWTGEYLIDSEAVQLYRKTTKQYWTDETLKNEFIEVFSKKHKPVKIYFHFVFNRNQRRDFHNFVQLPLDLMVEHGWIEDDRMDLILPYPLLINKQAFHIDKLNPGTIIKL